ncbi:hypothetical protein Bca52824_070789 [Brassica carinata]|uniref:Uncharacterized protein n=1 Tax=Brassica carinata TaxID=52824 RepID=A0A8X7Q7K3_BRACI|nr:hypothetical protein Bca52824_070789 [Brassica carinata]
MLQPPLISLTEENPFPYRQSGIGLPLWSTDLEPEQLQIFLLILVYLRPSPKRQKEDQDQFSRSRPSDADDEGPTTPASCMGQRDTTFSLMVELHRTLHCAKLSKRQVASWNKMQDSTIHKLKNSVKALKRQMKRSLHFSLKCLSVLVVSGMTCWQLLVHLLSHTRLLWTSSFLEYRLP